MDLEKLSLAELRDLDAKIAAQIARVESKRREAAIEEIYAVAHRLGMPLQSILDSRRGKPERPRREGQKYRDPSDPKNIWAGIGPRPAWFKKALAAGVALDALLA